MCNDNNIAKIKAKENVKLLICILMGVVIVGGVWEYKKAQAPLDNVLVVYHRSESVAKKIDKNVGKPCSFIEILVLRLGSSGTHPSLYAGSVL